jgi:prepilin-type N-terminal cleavage/methylation domain-containing protein
LPAQSKSAFTLLELLLAVLVFAIVLSAIHVVFFTALRLRNRTSEAIERALPLQQALGIIKRDLANLVPPGGTLSGQLQSTPTTSTAGGSMGRLTGPQFYTSVGIVNDDYAYGEIERVSYFLAAPTNDMPGQDLFRGRVRRVQRAQNLPGQFIRNSILILILKRFRNRGGHRQHRTGTDLLPDGTAFGEHITLALELVATQRVAGSA